LEDWKIEKLGGKVVRLEGGKVLEGKSSDLDLNPKLLFTS
jgi:hypothetical protein